MDKQVIINGDDFGIRPEVNEAIKRACTEGILTSTSIIANMPAATEAAAIAKELPQLDVGVHLNISQGEPLSEKNTVKPLLDKDGQFSLPQGKIWIKSLISRRFRKAVQGEFAAQIQWALDNGIRPTHLDSHMHIHSFPAIFSIVCRLAEQFDIKAVRWVYEPRQVSFPPWPFTSDEGRKKARFYRRLAMINRFQNSTPLKTNWFTGIAHSGRIDFNFFKAVASFCPIGVTEVITHPGVKSANFNTEKAQIRQNEFDGLCNKKIRQYFADNNVRLIHFGQL